MIVVDNQVNLIIDLVGADGMELGGICCGCQFLLLFLDGSCRCSFGSPGFSKLCRRFGIVDVAVGGVDVDRFFLFARFAWFGGCSGIIIINNRGRWYSCLPSAHSAPIHTMLTLQR